MKFLIISGISGSGKSKAASILEDIGYYVVDNLPAEMITLFMEFCKKDPEKYSKVVFVYDVRASEPFSNLLQAIAKMNSTNIQCQLAYFDADTQTIINRYKETRRRHPFSDECRNLEESIEKERVVLEPLKNNADMYIDTSSFSTIKLRSVLLNLFGTQADIKGIQVTVESFGFKNGIPKDADLLFDVRFLPNPYYVPELKKQTGLDKDVQEYVLSSNTSTDFLNKLKDMISFLIPKYRDEGKSYLQIAIGCTGGHHRSVAIAHILRSYIETLGYSASENHRDILI